ncbi:MAG: general secretion pathway protein GspD [Bacteroidetes bacterium]|nr:MAG: general secretion pathway protein GspD [Bacteroidota bacterium]
MPRSPALPCARRTRRRSGRAGLLLLLGLLGTAAIAPSALAQVQPPQRVLRTVVPEDQLVTFLPSTRFDEFIRLLNPIVAEVLGGKQIIDPESRSFPIGVTISSMQFFDAFEYVLEVNDLTYRETDRFYIVEDAPEAPDPLYLSRTAQTAPRTEELATARSREVQISAVIFEINDTRARELGINWSVWFGSEGTTGTGGTGGTGTGSTTGRPRFFIRTERVFDQFEEWLVAPNLIEVSSLTDFLRMLETTGIGETLANPTVTVQSGQEGRIQIGSDIPITTRDFAGNTINQFISTGIIINVTPTLIEDAPVDTLGGPTLDFIHLDVQVERSSGRPFASGIAIDRSTAETQVLLLDREMTIIGGLYSTEESTSRRGIPLLKDLPPWFFGLRYIFGYEQKTVSERELMIVLQARLLDPLPERASRPLPTEMLNQYRRQIFDTIQRLDVNRTRDLYRALPPPEGNQ